MTPSIETAAPDAPPRKAREELARNMLLGQHRVAYTAEHTGLPVAAVRALADRMLAARQIARVRA
jgi:hypothetical protein